MFCHSTDTVFYSTWRTFYKPANLKIYPFPVSVNKTQFDTENTENFIIELGKKPGIWKTGFTKIEVFTDPVPETVLLSISICSRSAKLSSKNDISMDVCTKFYTFPCVCNMTIFDHTKSQKWRFIHCIACLGDYSRSMTKKREIDQKSTRKVSKIDQKSIKNRSKMRQIWPTLDHQNTDKWYPSVRTVQKMMQKLLTKSCLKMWPKTE